MARRNHPSGPLAPLQVEPRGLRYPYNQPDPDRERCLPGETADEGRNRRRADNRAALTEALVGIELGDYDERILTWMAGWDIPTVATLTSLLHRARAAAPLTGDGR